MRQVQADAPWLKAPRYESLVRIYVSLRIQYEDLRLAIAKFKAESGEPSNPIPADKTWARLRRTVAGIERQLLLPRKSRVPRTATA